MSTHRSVSLRVKICAAWANFRISHRGGTEDAEGEFAVKKSPRTPRLCGQSRLPPFWFWPGRARFSAIVFALALGSGIAIADGPGLGKPIAESDLKLWDISILPDGTGLPSGSGTPAEGARIYAQKCLACHGENGKGGISAGLVGGAPITGVDSQKTIANFWPYATTVFDYIRRAMPWQQPRSLTNEEVYALTAYILALNKLIGENDTMNAQTLPKVKMPNRDGFIIRFPDKL
jgi:S-disulfanyl-L-cysteine oxidoreductase SoxD